MRKILVQALGTFSTPGQTIPRNFQKSFFFNFSGLSTENLYMCPVSTLAGRFFPKKKRLSFKKPIYVSCKHPLLIFLYSSWEPLDMRKILAQALGTFPTPGQPIPSNFQKSHLFNVSGFRPISHNL